MLKKINNKSIKIKFFSKKFFVRRNIDELDFSLLKEYDQKQFLIPKQTHSKNIVFPINLDKSITVMESLLPTQELFA